MSGEWPFIPDFISNDRPELQGQGIVPNRELCGGLTVFCANLKNPATIVEFDISGNWFRTDSYVRGYPLLRPCDLFREYANKEYCMTCDKEHAKLFCGLTRDNLEDELKKKIDESEYIKDYVGKGEAKPVVDVIEGRPYMAYDCPQLGYREVLFPIFFEGRVIAEIFLGEICLKGREKEVSKTQKKFFDKHPQCFTAYLRDRDHKTANCRNLIEQENEKLWKNEKVVLTRQKHNELLRSAHLEITALEERLASQIKTRREAYVQRSLDEAVREIHAKLPAELDIRKNQVVQLWHDLRGRIEALRQAFGFTYVAVFSRSTPFPTGSKLPLVVSAGTLPHREHETEELSFDPSYIPSAAHSSPAESDLLPTLLDGLPNELAGDKEEVTVLTYPVPFRRDMPLVLVVGHSRDTAPTRYPSLQNGLRTFEGVVVAILASMLEALAEERTRRSYQIMGHEAGQLTPGLEWIAELYLSSPQLLRELKDSKAEDLCRDIDAYIARLKYLFDNANRLIQMVWELPAVEKHYFLALGDLLLKWKDIYRTEIKRRKFQLVVPPAPQSTSDDPERPPVWGELSLLEQLVYNLINNAIKYSYRGTKIYLDCRKQPENGEHILTVIDYGRDMPPGDHYYELFERGESISPDPTDTEDGLGIGLFLARQIARAHGGDIWHQSERVSEFNVPLIRPYLRIAPEKIWGNSLLYSNLEEELKRLEKGARLKEIIAMIEHGTPAYDNPSVEEVRHHIGRPTHKVTISVSIPGKEGRRADTRA